MDCKTVTLRKRPMKKDMMSFYLDYYPGCRDKETMKVIRHEALGIYIYARPKNERERKFNEAMTEKAEAIRCRRYEALVNERYDFLDKERLKGDFLAYFRRLLPKHDKKRDFVYQHFCNYVQGKCTFAEIDRELCNGFREYLLNAKQLKHPNRRVSQNSAAGYWSTFRGLLNLLHRDKYITENINDYLEKIETTDVLKETLSQEEVFRLVDTPCRRPIAKTAALFSCLTSLRLSDVLKLRWDEIVDYPAGGKCVHTITQKTKTEDIIPVGHEALALIGYHPDNKGLVFEGMKRCWAYLPLKQWVADAGITKHISFHNFRYTYATLQHAAGTGMRTIQSNMGHRSITTTQHYTKLVDKSKLEAADRISLTREQ